MRQEPKLSDFDALDEPASAALAPPSGPTVIKRGMGFFAWLLLLICLCGVAGLGYWNLTLHGQTQSQGKDQSIQLGDLERRFDELKLELDEKQRLLAQQQTLNTELAERLDLLSGQGVSGNASAIARAEARITEVAASTQRLDGRLSALLEELGQSKDKDQSLTQRLAGVQSEQANVQTRLAALLERLDAQSRRLDAQDERVASLPTLLANSDRQMEQHSAELAQITGSLGALEKQLATLATQMRELAQREQNTPNDAIALEVSVIQEQVGQNSVQLREIVERLRAIDQFRAQTNQSIFKLEDAVRAAQ